MNCKIGDICYVINANNPANNGKIVEIVGFTLQAWGRRQEILDGPFWTTVGASIVNFSGERGVEVAFRDHQLRPIRDPGPDAVDETLRELEAA